MQITLCTAVIKMKMMQGDSAADHCITLLQQHSVIYSLHSIVDTFLKSIVYSFVIIYVAVMSKWTS